MPEASQFRITQVCVVVNDLDATVKAYTDILGWGPWSIYDYVPPRLHHSRLHGQDQDFTMVGAECEIQPGLWFEIIQPLDGPSIYREHLEKHGEGLHHIAMMKPTVEESDALRRHFEDRGGEVSMGGRFGETDADTIGFYYLDVPPLKLVVESGYDLGQEVRPDRRYPPAE